MDELQKQTEHIRIANLKRRKERYVFAKEKGFSPAECSILAGKSEKYIMEVLRKRKVND